MRRSVGETIGDIRLPAVDGTDFQLDDIRGKRFLLSFFRFAACPFCNLRVHELAKSLKLTSAELLAKLKTLKIPATSASSTLDADAINRLRKALAASAAAADCRARDADAGAARAAAPSCARRPRPR